VALNDSEVILTWLQVIDR